MWFSCFPQTPFVYVGVIRSSTFPHIYTINKPSWLKKKEKSNKLISGDRESILLLLCCRWFWEALLLWVTRHRTRGQGLGISMLCDICNVTSSSFPVYLTKDCGEGSLLWGLYTFLTGGLLRVWLSQGVTGYSL